MRTDPGASVVAQHRQVRMLHAAPWSPARRKCSPYSVRSCRQRAIASRGQSVAFVAGTVQPTKTRHKTGFVSRCGGRFRRLCVGGRSSDQAIKRTAHDAADYRCWSSCWYSASVTAVAW